MKPSIQVIVAAQAPYWQGYYHQRAAARARLSAGQLRDIGELLYGAQWQSDMARALGVGSRRVREWLERGHAPVWVRAELYGQLAARSQAAAAMAETLLTDSSAEELSVVEGY